MYDICRMEIGPDRLRVWGHNRKKVTEADGEGTLIAERAENVEADDVRPRAQIPGRRGAHDERQDGLDARTRREQAGAPRGAA